MTETRGRIDVLNCASLSEAQLRALVVLRGSLKVPSLRDPGNELKGQIA